MARHPLTFIQVGTAPFVHSSHAAKALQTLPDVCRLAGIVEEDPALRERAQTLPEFAALPFLTWEEAVAMKPDAFIVETDEHQLTANAIRSLEAGFHTYVDKPGSEDTAAFHRMCDLAKDRNLVLSLGYMFRENPSVKYALDLKNSGRLGDILSVEAQMSVCCGEGYRKSLVRFQGGMMYYLGCHMIDMVVHFCGFPENVIPLNRCTNIDVQCKDFGFCVLEYPRGVSFVKTTTWELNGVDRRSLTVNGTKGLYFTYNQRSSLYIKYEPSVFETNMMTGEKMTGEPIRIYVNYGHYEAVLKMD